MYQMPFADGLGVEIAGTVEAVGVAGVAEMTEIVGIGMELMMGVSWLEAGVAAAPNCIVGENKTRRAQAHSDPEESQHDALAVAGFD